MPTRLSQWRSTPQGGAYRVGHFPIRDPQRRCGATGSVAANIAQAERTARATEAMAADVVETADVLQGQADSLQDQVANFLLQLRSVNSTAGKGPSDASGEGREMIRQNVARSA